jgi:UDP-glucose 4-epimerase
VSIMITGGAGFLGSYLARYLVREQGRKDIVIFDKNPNVARIADIMEEVTIVQGDVLEPLEVQEAMRAHNVDRVLHLAFIAGTEEAGKALPYLRFQCGATANVFECARLQGIKRVVNASSHAVYGSRVGTVFKEDDKLSPGPVLYGACKVWTESVAENYNYRYGMEIISLRLQSAYGIGRVNRARDWAAGMIGTTMWKKPNFRANAELAALGEAVQMPPDADVDDFVHAADHAQAFWLASNAEKPKHFVFNVSNEHRPIGDYTRILRELLPEAKVTVGPMPWNPILLDNSRIRAELGFVPKYTLEDGLTAYVNEVRGNAGMPGVRVLA